MTSEAIHSMLFVVIVIFKVQVWLKLITAIIHQSDLIIFEVVETRKRPDGFCSRSQQKQII